MFSSENNSFPLYYHQSPSSTTNVISESNNNILFQHYHGNCNYILPPTFPPILENPITKLSSEPSINQQNTLLYPSNNNLLVNRTSSSRRPSGKKDRHTKICTAQGVRDRRVRLSMNIAREFFNLQDMLGFDKASKTLGWLLAKSKAAIDELTENPEFNNIVTSNVDTNNENQEDDDGKKESEESLSKKRKKKEKHVDVRNVSNEFRRREEARNRARERTRKKKIDTHNNHHHLDQLEGLDHQLVLHHHQRIQQDLMICQSSSALTLPNDKNSSYGVISKEISVGESAVMKGSNSSSESSYNYNYEFESLKNDQENCNYYNGYLNKSASESCTYGGIIAQPTGFPALNIINLSTEIHINARPWDNHSNQFLH